MRGGVLLTSYGQSACSVCTGGIFLRPLEHCDRTSVSRPL